ncbi:membrane protein [Luteibacter yeojuensis]|uniref:Membrane protein n=1 Tax=Luteibacter yeojuensis TaxID=345309 RepID=A0A0F3KID4_9GAMM|nr:membrane protein [Luteibacter yeojuensis]
MPPATNTDDKNIAMLTHLSGILFSIIMPLIVWLMHKDRADKAYLVTEAKEALNFQITVLIGYVICWILTFLLIGMILTPLLWLANLIFCIIAAVKVSSDGTYRYPFALRLIS